MGLTNSSFNGLHATVRRSYEQHYEFWPISTKNAYGANFWCTVLYSVGTHRFTDYMMGLSSHQFRVCAKCERE